MIKTITIEGSDLRIETKDLFKQLMVLDLIIHDKKLNPTKQGLIEGLADFISELHFHLTKNS